jgi:aryl-alcohol dehydrogenase-like predicted oxidoreductase
LALAYVLAQPWSDCVLSGAATVEHLQSNLGALQVRVDEQAQEALASLAEPVEDYYRTRSELEWN